jgi:hypothetical protein
MKQPAIFESIYNKLTDRESVSIDEIKTLLTVNEFIDFKTYIRIFSKTIFRAYGKELPEDKIHQIMVLRREIYIDDPVDQDEYKELIDHFESVEDYESCQRLIKTKK